MKSVLYFVLALGVSASAWADVQIKYQDITGATSTMRSNGERVRINGGQTPGYMLVDGKSGEFFMVDSKRKEIIRVAADEVGSTIEVGALDVSLKPRGGGEQIAGYATGRFDLIANGELCGTLYGSSELMKNQDMRRMFEAMQGMHKITRSMMAGMAPMLTPCQRANARMADLADTSGFVLRVIDEQGKQVFEVIAINTDKDVDPDYYELPAGMTVVDMNEKMKEVSKQGQPAMQQMPDMNEIMKQIQQSGGEITPEMQQQLQQMMEQFQKQQPQ
jgi:hypothetical protein